MSDAMVIPLEIDLTQHDAAIKSATKNWGAADAAVNKTRTDIDGVVAASRRMATAPTPTLTNPTRMMVARGSAGSRPARQTPWERQEQARQQLALAHASADPDKIRAAKYQSLLVDRQVKRADDMLSGSRKSSFSKRAGEFIRSTRYGEAGVQPLIGRTLDLIGAGGPFGQAITASIAALGLFVSAVEGAAQRQNQFSDNRFLAGSTPKETAQLDVLGAALGMDGKSMAQIAKQFSSSLSTNPQAMAAFGMQDMPGPFGKLDKADQLMKGIAKLNGMSEDQAIRAARTAPEMEGLVRLRYLTRNGINILDRMAADREETYGRTPRDAMDISVASAAVKGEVQQGIDERSLRAARAVLDRIWQGDKSGKPLGYSDVPGVMATAAKGFFGFGGDAAASTGSAGGSPSGRATQNDPASHADPHVVALDNLDASVRALVQTMTTTNRMMTGGGQRARDATPSHARYMGLKDFLHDERQRLGQL